MLVKNICNKFFPILHMNRRAMLSNNVSSRIQLSVLGNGSMMQPSVVITTDKVNYLFNCGEGSQRMIIEHNKHLKMGKLQYVFFTSTKYENWSGFFGLILTMASVRNQMTFAGSHRFQNIIKLYEQFLYSAGNVKLNHIVTDDKENVKDLFEDDDFFIRSISHKESTAYILLTKDKTGKLLIENCKKFKIPPGPKFAALKNGETIEIDGKIIEPKDVLGPPEIGTAFVIWECPFISDLKEFLEKLENFTKYLMDKELELIVHLSPEEVIENPHYQEWLKKFDPKIKHLFLNQKTKYELGFLSSTELQIKLNLLDGQLFKLLNEKQFKYDGHENRNLIANCPTLLTYRLRPRVDDKKKIEILDSNCCEINKEEVRNQIIQQSSFNFSENSSECLRIEPSSIINVKYPNVLFLGTASSSPGKQRNTSAIMVNLEDRKSMLFDCGESTFIQLKRFFGRDNVQDVIANIEGVFISHYHPDHHFGLIKLIKERSKSSNRKPLLIIAPYSILSFLSLFDDQMEDLSSHYEGIACETLLYGARVVNSSDIDCKQNFLSKIGLDDLVTVHVPHCFESYGIVINYQGKRIAYSGDSMYSDAFDQAGRDCDLLIHEATMNDDLADEAVAKRHSTISQAIQVGHKIGAKYTLLTHFSQRYAKMAPISLIEDQSLASYIEDRVAISFDFMQVSLDDLDRAAKLKRPLELLFDEVIQQMQDVVTKRNFKRKLLEESVG